MIWACNTQEGIHRTSERTLRAFSSLDGTLQLLARYTRIGVSDLDSAIWDGTAWKTKHSCACRRIMMMFNFTFRSCTKHLYHVITNFYKRVTLPLSTGVMNMESRLPAFIAKYNTETKLWSRCVWSEVNWSPPKDDTHGLIPPVANAIRNKPIIVPGISPAPSGGSDVTNTIRLPTP